MWLPILICHEHRLKSMLLPAREPFEKISRFIKRHSMLDGASGVVVAVSGGADSVALLDVLMRLDHGSHLHVAHLDHMLRGRESSEDAEFVRRLSERLGVPVTISSVDVRAAARGRGVEEIAREIRYQFLLRIANQTNCDRIAAGHTMTDQAETFLMRLVRGSGLRGLSAMRPVVPAHSFAETVSSGQWAAGSRQEAELPSAHCLLPSVSLIRPLLCITREEVERYCRERGLGFRSDSSNLSRRYTRNRIRNEILPALKAINPQVVKAIARAADNLASDQEALDHLASALVDQSRLQTKSHTDNKNEAAYSVPALLAEPSGMRRRMIIEAIRLARLASSPGKPPHAGEIVSAHVAAVEALLEAGSSGKRIALPGGLKVWREFDALVVKRTSLAVEEQPYRSAISLASPQTEAGGFSFSLSRSLPNDSLKSVIEETQREKERSGRDWMMVALDAAALPDHLIIRARQPGELAHVTGQRKTKKLKNLMIDHRIPTSRRADWPIVTTADGRYVWSPGLPPALQFAADDKTQGLAIMRASAI